MLLTTHYMEEAFQICDRIIIMDGGRKILEGPLQTLLSANLEKFVMVLHSFYFNYGMVASEWLEEAVD